MVRVIMGVKGTGKTKQMIELINAAAKSESGSVVCIEHGSKLTYDIHYQIRLIEAKEYKLENFDMMKGFISGLHAGNYDITQVFIESLTKIVGADPNYERVITHVLPAGEAQKGFDLCTTKGTGAVKVMFSFD